MEFLSRADQTSEYLHTAANWLKAEYPGSIHLLPRLRELYARQKKSGK